MRDHNGSINAERNGEARENIFRFRNRIRAVCKANEVPVYATSSRLRDGWQFPINIRVIGNRR